MTLARSSVKAVINLYEARLGLRALHVIGNSGTAAQQDELHAHFHIIPRSEGDGQDRWRDTYPALGARFDELLGRLGSICG